jgi:hypothetical protein
VLVQVFYRHFVAPTMQFFAVAAGVVIKSHTSKDLMIERLLAAKVIPLTWKHLEVYSEAYKKWQLGLAEVPVDRAALGPRGWVGG